MVIKHYDMLYRVWVLDYCYEICSVNNFFQNKNLWMLAAGCGGAGGGGSIAK